MMARALLLPVLVVAIAGAAHAEEPVARPVVVVSVLPQKYVVDRLAGDRVAAEVMIPPGASPATYEPTLAQMKRLGEAALYLKVGHPSFPFEAAWLDRLLADTPGLPVVDSSAGVERRKGDPHVWVAPRHVEQMAIQTGAAIAKILPQRRGELQANLKAFRAEIDALDQEIQSLLASKKGRKFLVFHPAWGYFAEAYGLEQVAIEHEHKEPDARELGELIEQAREEKVAVVFVQPQFDPASAELLASEIGARVEPLDPLAYDWPANLRRAARAIAGALPQ
jgi:zinc transport system substrate-binding protein